MHLLQEGQQINNIYLVERFLGEGAFAEVYRVRHRFMGRQAMKVFKAIGLGIKDIEQMLGEATTLSQIGHPNIIRVFDANVFESEGSLHGYFTMEYIAGGSLDSFWKSFGMKLMPVETAVEILRQAARGLSVAHNEKPPIIHRDIKPQNILVGYDCNGLRVVISDFGLAKRANPLTLMVSAKGTRIMKAPETFKDYQSDSCAGDVWALGCTLYLLLTDRFPFSEPGTLELIDEYSFERPLIPPSQLNLTVDAALDQIVLRCLALDPKARYPTAKELLVDLEKWKPQPEDKKEAARAVASSSAKSALGELSSLNQKKAYEMADRALRLARHVDKLAEAADLMEEACNKWPELREEHGDRIMLWRRGIMA